MSKFCKKCGKEIPQDSKRDTCENCQNQWFGKVRKIGGGVLSLAVTVGGVVLMVVTKGKSGGPKA